jgi:hypothetical protein
MADIFQGDVLPSITSTAQAQTTAPEFYTNYLQDVANLGQAGVQMGGVAGMSPLQQQALSMAPQASFAGLGTMGMGADLAAQSGTTTAPQMVGQYMNPYTQNVVEEMGRLQGRQINENLLPAMQGAAGGMGQFGSQRQFNATGNMLRDMQSNLIGQQYGALNTGYGNAMTAAQADLQRQMQAGQTLGGLGSQQQQGATSGLTNLFGLGQKEQDLGQRQLDYPMTAAQNYSKLMQGLNIPTGETKQTVGSTGYTNSPLSQITGLLAALGSFASPGSTTSLVPNVNSANGSIGVGSGKAEGGAIRSEAPTASSNIPSGASYHDGQGNFYDASGNLVR